MSLKTTELQFRQKHFKTIHKIIVEKYGISVPNENIKISEFVQSDYQHIEFEILLQKAFDENFDLNDESTISDILDQICQ